MLKKKPKYFLPRTRNPLVKRNGRARDRGLDGTMFGPFRSSRRALHG